MCPVLSCFTFIFNIFVISESMYIVMMIEKKNCSCNILGAGGQRDGGQGPRVEEHKYPFLKVFHNLWSK